MMQIGIDTAAPLSATNARDFYAAGYRFAARYFATPGCGSKILKADEAKRIGNAGLRILSVFEVSGTDFAGGEERGKRYGEAALECARDVGMPETGIIYFAIDSAPTDYELVADYLRGCAEGCAPYRIGVYGCYDTIEAMAERNVAAAYWQCVGWSGRKISRHVDVYQHNWNVKECGVTVDQNICVDMDKAGLWLPGADKLSSEASCPWLEPKGNLRRGSSGNGVRWLQWQLNRAGAALDMDGSFGAATEQALIAFQRDHSLTQDGICGPLTRAALVE